MNKRADRTLLYGTLLIALSGSMLAQSTDPAIAATAAGASVTNTVTPPGGRAHDNNFVIGNDDVLSINVWKEPEFTQSIPVRSDGKISLPLIGEIQAAGRTPLQLEQDITTKLKTYITDPDVTVMVSKINSQKFNILGRVAKPGSYPLSAASTVLDAIAAAGGFQDFAKQKGVYVLRSLPSGGETRIAFNYKDVIRGKHPEENIRLQAHDTIIVP
jgi:polysaccharide biosynthesis/export protein